MVENLFDDKKTESSRFSEISFENRSIGEKSEIISKKYGSDIETPYSSRANTDTTQPQAIDIDDVDFDELDQETFVQLVQSISYNVSQDVTRSFASGEDLEQLIQFHTRGEINQILSSQEYQEAVSNISKDAAKKAIDDWKEDVDNIENSVIGDFVAATVNKEVDDLDAEVRSNTNDIGLLQHKISENAEQSSNNKRNIENLAANIDSRFVNLYGSITNYLVKPTAFIFALVASGLTIPFALEGSIITLPLILLSLLLWLAVWNVGAKDV